MDMNRYYAWYFHTPTLFWNDKPRLQTAWNAPAGPLWPASSDGCERVGGVASSHLTCECQCLKIALLSSRGASSPPSLSLPFHTAALRMVTAASFTHDSCLRGRRWGSEAGTAAARCHQPGPHNGGRRVKERPKSDGFWKSRLMDYQLNNCQPLQ